MVRNHPDALTVELPIGGLMVRVVYSTELHEVLTFLPRPKEPKSQGKTKMTTPLNDQTVVIPELTFAPQAETANKPAANALRFAVDLTKFVETGLGLVGYAMTRAGKSHFLRGLCEQTYGRVQQIIVDSEGEFSTLRTHFDYLLAAGGEAPGDVRLSAENAADLCRIVMEKGVSVILDISDMGEEGRGVVAAAFLTQLLETPHEHRRPCFVIVDEVHRFAPEGGQRSASARALSELGARGAKRGLIPIFATQNIAKTSKRVIEELPNKLVGRLTLDTHVDRAVDDLGLRSADAETLKNLPRGHFYMVGPSLCDVVTQVQTGPNETAPPPRFAGALAKEPLSATAAILELVAALASLPKAPEAEVQNLEVARVKIADLTRRLQNTPPPKVERVEIPVPVLDDATSERIERLVGDMMGVGKDLVGVGGELLGVLKKVRPTRCSGTLTTVKSLEVSLPASPPAERGEAATQPSPKLTPVQKPTNTKPANQQAFLNTLAEFEALGLSHIHNKTLTIFAGYSPTSSGPPAHLRALKEAGLIAIISGALVGLTGQGRAIAKTVGKPPTLAQLHAAWLSKLPDGPAKMLRPLLTEWRNTGKMALPRMELIKRTGYSVTSSGPMAHIRTLVNLGLVKMEGSHVHLTSLLFPKGLK